MVGEQPELEPGDSYQYMSGCPLSTPSGIMVGRYTMRNGRGDTFDIAIPAFSLDMPGEQAHGELKRTGVPVEKTSLGLAQELLRGRIRMPSSRIRS